MANVNVGAKPTSLIYTCTHVCVTYVCVMTLYQTHTRTQHTHTHAHKLDVSFLHCRSLPKQIILCTSTHVYLPTIQRQNIDSHVTDECPLTTINCDFHHVGCAVKVPRQDMPEHQREKLLTHISLLATSHAKQQAEITKHQQNITRLVTENEQLKTKITDLEPIQQLLKTAPPVVNFRPLGPLEPPVLTMTDFQQHKRDDDIWYSPPVYTHHLGYKICLRADANGGGIGKGTHVTVGVCLMKGEFDNSLKWPFRGVISVGLLDQVNSKDHKTYITTTMICTRVTGAERSIGWGHPTFIAHTELEPKYLQNDTLLFQIHGV